MSQYMRPENFNSAMNFFLCVPETFSAPCRLSYWIIYTLLLVVETLLWPALKW